MTKKLHMLLGTILGILLVLIVCGFMPSIPQAIIEYAIGGIASAGGASVVSQGIADGMSRGLTSSNSKEIIAAQLQTQVIQSVSPVQSGEVLGAMKVADTIK